MSRLKNDIVKMRKAVVGLSLIVAFLIGLAGSAAAAPLMAGTGGSYGFNHHPYLSEEDAKILDYAKATGAQFIRTDFLWPYVEQERGRYNFSGFDKLLARLQERNLRPVFLLAYGNRLYGDDKTVLTPEQRIAFARYAGEAAKHYKGQGVIWEIWNEPNFNGFSDNMGAYTAMAAECAAAIKAADPDATVIGPGICGMDFKDIENAFKAGLLNHVDAVAVHPYRETAPETASKDFERLRNLIAAYKPTNKTIPIVVSEWGYSSALLHRDENWQANLVARSVLISAMEGCPFTIIYEIRNGGRNLNEKEENFGIVTNDYYAKPGLQLQSEMGRVLAGKQFVQRLNSAPNDYLLLFSDGTEHGNVLACWTTGSDHDIKVSDYISMTVTGKPQFVRFSRGYL